MGLINKIFEPVKSFVKKRKNEICLFTTLSLLSLITSCSDTSDGDKKKTTPVNHAPVIEAQADGVINENSEFVRNINIYDADGDETTPYLVDSPVGATLEYNTTAEKWQVKFTPDDSQSNQNHNFTVGADDGQLPAEDESFNVYAVNTTTAKGNVGAFPDGTPLENMKLTMYNATNGTFIAYTGAGGNWQIANLPDGDYDTTIEDDNAVPVYDKYNPQIFQSMKSKEVGGEIVKNARLSKKGIHDFLNDTERYNGDLRKWNVKPKLRIFTKDEYDGNIADGSRMTGLTARITDSDKLSGFFQDTYNLTSGDIEVIESTRAEYFNGYTQEEIDVLEEGYITIRFDDYTIAQGDGGNICYFNADKSIQKAYIYLNTSDIGNPTANADLQELTESVIGSGETNDPSHSDSILYDDGVPGGAETYSQADWETSQRHYNQEYQRQLRNTSDAPVWPDYDPTGSIWNK